MPCCQSLRLSQFHALLPEPETFSISCMPCCQEPETVGNFMHALMPEPETFSISCMPCCQSLKLSANSCMPCCQSLRLSQIHACPAARAGDSRRTGAKIEFPYKEFIKKSTSHSGQEKHNKNARSQPPPPPKNALPEPETFSISRMPCCQSLRLSQIHACPAARA